MCLEELGPTFIKLGQILSTRSDVLPLAYIQEFRKLQDQVPAVNFETLLATLEEQYPQGVENVFEWVEQTPIGSASIAQVHRAQLKTGEKVVLKIQKPGIEKMIREDIEVMRFIANYLESSLFELQSFDVKKLVEEFAQTIECEIDFIIEANHVRRFYENFQKRESIIIPKPYLQWSGSRVLVMEYVNGTPLTDFEKVTTEAQREQLLKKSLQAYFAMIFKDGLFHGDLHAGNILIVDQEHLAFVDFGVVGRLSRRLQTSITNLFLALAEEDYERLAEEYIEISSPHSAPRKEVFANDLRKLLAPYFGLSLKNVNMGKILLDSVSVAARNNLSIPAELLLFFKSIVTLEGLGRTLKSDFDLLPIIYEFSAEIIRLKYNPSILAQDASALGREMSALARILPGELKSYLRRVNHPNYIQRVEINNLQILADAKIKSAKIIFFALTLSSLIIAAAIYFTFIAT